MTDQRGFTCNFVKDPPEAIQSECPACLQIIRDQFQATCCGSGYYRVCIEQIKQKNDPCPSYKQREFDIFENKRLKQSLYTRNVYCSHQAKGCQWLGELGHLDNHLNLKPSTENQLEGCQYTEIQRIYCFELMQRSDILVHQIDECSKRPFSCEYCKIFTSDYQDVTINHWSVCDYYTVQCRNNCGEILQRQHLKNHLGNDCPLTIIDCDFKYAGCKVKLPRKDMPKHLKSVESMAAHLSQQAVYQREENRKLTSQVAKLNRDLQQLQISTPMCPVEIPMPNFKHHKESNDVWCSMPFYSHPKGYKLYLRIFANGTKDTEGTHLSVGVALMKGEYDKQLKWPFQFDFMIELLSQNGDQDHYTRKIDAPPLHLHLVQEFSRSNKQRPDMESRILSPTPNYPNTSNVTALRYVFTSYNRFILLRIAPICMFV